MKTVFKVLLCIVGLFLFGLLAIVLALSQPLFPKTNIDTFTTADGKTTVVLENKRRVRIGKETNINVWVIEHNLGSMHQKIDHNGRLEYSEDYFFQISKGRSWVRSCKLIENPETGNRVWRTNSERWPEANPEKIASSDRFTRGVWMIEPFSEEQGGQAYTFKCDAYINYRNDRFIRAIYPASTLEERESLLFAPRKTDELRDVVDGQDVTWESLKRDSSAEADSN
jgi:hypothetical protein